MSTIKCCDRCGKQEQCIDNLTNKVVHHFKVINVTLDQKILDLDLCEACALTQFAPVAQTVRADGS